MLFLAGFATGVLVSVATGLVAREFWRWRARRNYFLAAGWRDRALRAEAVAEARGVLGAVRRAQRDGGAHAPQPRRGARG